MKNVMYKIIVGCYIVAALVLVTACNDSLDIQQAYPFTVETLPVPKKLKVGETAEIRCQLVRGGDYQLRPTRYAISSLTAKENWKWITVRCSCPMTCTRWRKKRSGSTTHRHRLTSRRLTSISSTVSGRCSRFRSRSIMIKKNPNNNIQDMHLLIFNKKEHILFIVTIYSVTLQENKVLLY